MGKSGVEGHVCFSYTLSYRAIFTSSRSIKEHFSVVLDLLTQNKLMSNIREEICPTSTKDNTALSLCHFNKLVPLLR
jgi:hypothetical protein